MYCRQDMNNLNGIAKLWSVAWHLNIRRLLTTLCLEADASHMTDSTRYYTKALHVHLSKPL